MKHIVKTYHERPQVYKAYWSDNEQTEQLIRQSSTGEIWKAYWDVRNHEGNPPNIMSQSFETKEEAEEFISQFTEE